MMMMMSTTTVLSIGMLLMASSIYSMSSESPLVGLVAAEEGEGEVKPSSVDNSLELSFTMIPDQDTEVEQARGDAVSTYLSSILTASSAKKWGQHCSYDTINVSFVPATDYQDAVDAILDGRVDFGWYGGLTGVEVLQRGGVENFEFWVQRLEDQSFTTTFIYYDNEGEASSATSYESLSDVENKSFAFGSELSTSGHLMPQYFLDQDDVELDPFKTVFTGSHDATIDVVTNGTVQVGAVNTLTWERRLASNDTGWAEEFFVTDQYVDYMWVGRRRSCSSHSIHATTSTLSSLFGYDDTGCDNNDVITPCSDYFLDGIRSAILDVSERSQSEPSFSSGDSISTAQSAQSILDTFSTVGFVSVDIASYEPIYTTACSLELLNCTMSEDENGDDESTTSGGPLNDGSGTDNGSSSGPRNGEHLWSSTASIIIWMSFVMVIYMYQ